MILDKMGPTNQPKKSILTLAAKSVLSKRDRDLMEEESKLLEKYYQDYYSPSKNGSNRSRGSSTDSRHEHKKVGFKSRKYMRWSFLTSVNFRTTNYTSRVSKASRNTLKITTTITQEFQHQKHISNQWILYQSQSHWLQSPLSQRRCLRKTLERP